MYINGQPCGGAFFRGERIFDATPKDEPFYVEDISGLANTLSIQKSGSSAPTITVEKSTDGVTWETMGTTSTTAITATIPANGKLYLRASATRWGDGGWSNKITASRRHNVGGNIKSLLMGSSFDGLTRNLTSTNTFAFYYLFYGNTNLVSAENLILNTTLAQDCYNSMFRGCTSLTTAPDLPATTLADACYIGMFRGCTSLTTAPSLPATTLVYLCYDSMFYNCTSLNYIKCLATNISASSCLGSWVQSVAPTGTFIKDANMTSWPTGNSGIPSKWTVQDAA